MQPMTVTEIASAVKGVWWNPSEQVPVVSAVSTDSRRIVPGSLFLPWVGEKFDGHLFIDAALDAGAAGCLCAKLPQNIREDKFYIKVADTRLALRDLASAYRDRFADPLCADHRQRGQDNHQGDDRRRAGGQAERPQDAGEFQQ